MRAVICRAFDGIEALAIGEADEPVAGPDQVLVDVHAAALSFMDTLMVSGRYQMKPALPFIPGSDAAGVVLAVGRDVRSLRVGDRVACGHWHGGMAERMVASEYATLRLPDNVGFAMGSAVRYAYGTARYALATRASLAAGETVFVTGASGGVGLAAVDVARQIGAVVIAGTSSAAKGDIARSQGATHVIDYACEPVRERLAEVTRGRGVDVFFDTVGGSLFAATARSMAWAGRILPVGFTSGDVPLLAMNLPLLKSLSVLGCYWGAWTERQPRQSREADIDIVDAVSRGALRPRLSDILPFENFAEGMRRIATRQAAGRIVLSVKSTCETPS